VRIAFLTNIISPYRKPVFEHLAATPGWEFRVFVNAVTEFDRAWDVGTGTLDVVVPRTLSVRRTVRSVKPVAFDQTITLHIPLGLWSALRRFRPDVIISHELGPRTLLAAAYCARHGVPLVIWSYQSRISATQGQRSRRAVRRWILRRAAAVVGMGTQARDVLQGLGVEPERIIDVPNAADVATLQARLADPSAADRVRAIRRTVGKGRRLALVVGRLVPLKGTATLLEQWRGLDAAQRRGWTLAFVGHGPLERLVETASGDDVTLVGPVPPDELADWYAAADLHVFPSLGDVWGLVANEAMACGTPTLCSVHAGCSDDLIEHGRTGLLYDPIDPKCDGLASALQRSDLETIGEAGRQRVARATPDRLAGGLREAVERAARVRTARPAASAIVS